MGPDPSLVQAGPAGVNLHYQQLLNPQKSNMNQFLVDIKVSLDHHTHQEFVLDYKRGLAVCLSYNLLNRNIDYRHQF